MRVLFAGLLLSSFAAIAACDSDSSSSSSSSGAPADGGGADSAMGPDDGGGKTDAGADAAPDGGEATAPGPGPYTIVYAGSIVGIDVRPVADKKAVFAGNTLTAYESSEDERPTLGTNMVKEPAASSLFALGRWAGGKSGGKFYQVGGDGLLHLPANGGFHYAIAIPSNPVPSGGMTSYTELAKTAATVSDGATALGTVAGTLAMNLAGPGTKVGFSVTLNVPGDTTYTVASTGGAAAPSVGLFTDGALASAAAFTADIPLTGGNACTAGGSCHGAVWGVVSGPNAENVVLVVHVYSASGGNAKSVSGAIAFKK